jgi:hypothetical protein
VSLLLAGCEDEEPRDGVFVELLRLMPDRPEVRAHIEMGDVERAREALGVDVPPEAVDGKFNVDGFADYVLALVPPVNQSSAPSNRGRSAPVAPNFFVARPYTLPFAEVTYASMGISPFDVDQWVMGGDPGPRELHAIRGCFDPGEVRSRLNDCAGCAAATTEDFRGWRVYGWGADYETPNPARRLQPPMFDHLGRGSRLAVSESVLMRAFSTDDIHAMVDAASGVGSLADNWDFRLAAEGLERLGAWNATITERTFGPADQESEGLLLRYAVMAFGERYDGGKHDFVVALVHRTPQDATESARRLPARIPPAQREFAERSARDSVPIVEWDKLISNLDVQTEGRLLLARLRLEDFPGGFLLFLSGVLAHE